MEANAGGSERVGGGGRGGNVVGGLRDNGYLVGVVGGACTGQRREMQQGGEPHGQALEEEEEGEE